MFGGEGGIRTLDTLPYTHFPGVLLRPLGHLSVEVIHSATPQRPSPLLPLLPSRPGGVHSKLPQGDQVDHHRAAYASPIRRRMKSETGVGPFGGLIREAEHNLKSGVTKT